MHICKWDRMFDHLTSLNAGIDEESLPFCQSAGADDVGAFRIPARQFKGFSPICAEPAAVVSGGAAAARVGAREDQARLPVGGLPPRHRVPVAELFERHDRARLRGVGVSFGPDDGSAMRARLIGGVRHFIDVARQRRGDRAAAPRAGDRHRGRPEGLHRTTRGPASSRCARRRSRSSYLGYPGTMGAPFIDYIIADRDRHRRSSTQPFYTEKIVYLPDSYQVNDASARIAERTPTRAARPACRSAASCSAASTTATRSRRAMFDVWMRLLRAVDGSVLWLLRDNASRRATICGARREARGVDPARLVFAPRCQLEDHLARHRLADLFLDTLPYNAHTTASDALWAGLPVVTCPGTTFAGRVAASLLTAAGLPELITHTPRRLRGAGAGARARPGAARRAQCEPCGEPRAPAAVRYRALSRARSRPPTRRNNCSPLIL